MTFRILLGFFASLLLVGCDQGPSSTRIVSTTQAAGAGGGKTYTIGMSQANLGEPWRVQMNADVKADGIALDATLQYPTGGAEAIQNALNIVGGEQMPKEVTLGSRLFTEENIDAGGEVLP